MKKLLLVFALMLVCIQFAHAEQVVISNDNITFVSQCLEFSGSVCTACKANLTMMNASNSLIVNNKNMTKSGNLWNYSLGTLPLGDYPFSVICYNGDVGNTQGVLTVTTTTTSISYGGGGGGSGSGSVAIDATQVKQIIEQEVLSKAKTYAFYAIIGIIALFLIFRAIDRSRTKRMQVILNSRR